MRFIVVNKKVLLTDKLGIYFRLEPLQLSEEQLELKVTIIDTSNPGIQVKKCNNGHFINKHLKLKMNNKLRTQLSANIHCLLTGSDKTKNFKNDNIALWHKMIISQFVDKLLDCIQKQIGRNTNLIKRNNGNVLWKFPFDKTFSLILLNNKNKDTSFLKETFQAVPKPGFEIVLADIYLSVKEGIKMADLQNRFQNRDPAKQKLRMFAITDYASEQLSDQIENAGMELYLHKEYKYSDTIKIINDLNLL